MREGPGPLLIRPGAGDDQAAVQALVASVLDEYGLSSDPAFTDADLSDIETHYWDRNGVFLVVEGGEGEIVGCGGLMRRDPTEAELRKMYLLPRWRRRGVGRRMLLALLAEARRRGYRRITLETATVLKEAIGLYETAGFRRIDRANASERCDQVWELHLEPLPS